VVPLAGAALAHQPERSVVRELVWLKGRHGGAEAPLVLVALGAEHHFAVTELKRFAVGEAAVTPSTAFERERLVLQGSRELLARFAGARADQTVTILAERRPGAADLFLIALDLCP
jgi:hypothetical protein